MGVFVFVHNICVFVFHAETFGIMQIPVGDKKNYVDPFPSQKSFSLLLLLSFLLFVFVI